MVELLESVFTETHIGAIMAIGLCLGGNDFLPRFSGISHLKVLQMLFSKDRFRQELLELHETNGVSVYQLNERIYLDFVKSLYCPRRLDEQSLSFEEVRQLTIKPSSGRKAKNDNITFVFCEKQIDVRQPKLWLPPSSCLQRLSTLVTLMLRYLATAGHHDASLPQFSDSCLSADGHHYLLGPDAHCPSLDKLLVLHDDCVKRKEQIARAKRALERTPRRSNKRRPVFSTPKKRLTLN